MAEVMKPRSSYSGPGPTTDDIPTTPNKATTDPDASEASGLKPSMSMTNLAPLLNNASLPTRTLSQRSNHVHSHSTTVISPRSRMSTPSTANTPVRPTSFLHSSRPPSTALNAPSLATTARSSRASTNLAYPLFPSSLPYAAVRDFAYPAFHPLHYGPPASPTPSSPSSPEPRRRGSDSGVSDSTYEREYADAYGYEHGHGSAGNDAWEEYLRRSAERGRAFADADGNIVQPIDPDHAQGFVGADVVAKLPRSAFDGMAIRTGGEEVRRKGDGPPWSEDEDLQSPVVMPKSRGQKRKKSKGSRRRGVAVGAGGEADPAGEDGGALLPRARYERGRQRDPNEPGDIKDGEGSSGSSGEESSSDDEDEGPDAWAGEASGAMYVRRTHSVPRDSGSTDPDSPSRFSRTYAFTIVDPDEEMHGKAVALYDFARENENELPLVEGQVILVSYRHGQGWLVAQDPRSGESGLVPEEYVRLLRDIEGGAEGLGLMDGGREGPDGAEYGEPAEEGAVPAGGAHAKQLEEAEIRTPTQGSYSGAGLPEGAVDGAMGNGNGQQAYVSRFSTSREDFKG